MIHVLKPEDPLPQVQMQVVGCFVELGDNILLLQKAKEPHLWGTPGGKAQQCEDLLDAMAREFVEETGIVVGKNDFEKLATVFVDTQHYSAEFLYHMFRLRLGCVPHIVLSKEHQAFLLTRPCCALSYNLMPDEDACIKLVYCKQMPEFFFVSGCDERRPE